MLKKVVVDILMFICMILEFSRWYMQPIFHEIVWIILVILVVLHLRLNRVYFKSFLKWHYNVQRFIMAIINFWFMVCFILTIVFWILSSQNLLTSLNVHSMTIIKLHKIFSYITLVLMWLHLGINIGWLINKITTKIWKIPSYIIWILFIWYWIYAWLKLDIRKHITWVYWFSLIDGNIAINIIRYIWIIVMITIITNYIYNLTRKLKTN